MDLRELERLLRAFREGELDETEAARRISNLHFEDIGHARVDHARAERQGFPEVVFGEGKTRAQVVEIVEALARRAPRVLVVVAGMEGALPSVVGGLVAAPVIAVPTSVGYGASFGGVAALLGMLNSCASNVTVVNIDNGFGAGFVASLINRKVQSVGPDVGTR